MRLRLLGAAALLLLAQPAFGQARVQNSGVFVDRTGGRHSWSVTGTHALLWDRQPYLPVGGVFCSRWLAGGQKEEDWKRDVEGLEALKAKGVLDLIVNPVVSAVRVPAEAWQRLVDHLDAGGFRYGVAFGAGVETPLTGTVVKPGSYRVRDVAENVDVTWTVSDADSARWVFADKDGLLLKVGEARVQNGVVRVPYDPRFTRDSVGLLYPRKTLAPAREGTLPDLWAGFDGYRDRLLDVLGRVKFGPGLRFFLDPLAHPLGLTGDAEYFVPDSPAFRLHFESFLTQKYQAIEELIARWGLLDREVKDFRQAAALVPLGAGRRGVAHFWDPTTGRTVEMDGFWERSRYWSDLRECRNDSLVYYMNATADLLKREIAGVPVVYTYTHPHRMYVNRNRVGGFDGLGVAAYARGSALVTGGADSAFSQAGESVKTMWFLVTETLDTASPSKTAVGYSSREALFQDLDWLRGIGAKGFFVNGFQVLPEDVYASFQLLKAPEQIEWLKEYSSRLNRGVDVAQSQPRTLPFPARAAGLVQAGPLGRGGVWWVPSTAPGEPLEFGASYAGYTIALPEGPVTVLWSLRGARETHLSVAEPKAVHVATPDGLPVPAKVDAKRKLVTLVMDANPAVIRSGGQEVFPVEAAADALKQLQALVKQAADAKLGADQYEYTLSNAASVYQRSPRMAFNMCVEALNGIGGVVLPYHWLEAELADPHQFSEAAPEPAASGGGLLLLNTETKPGPGGYTANFRFTAPVDDQYMIWVAATPRGVQTSPFTVLVDADEPRSSADATAVGSPYLSDRLAWLRMGRATLKRGPHTLTVRVDERAASGRYFLALDTVVVTRYPFTPSGTARPPLALIDDSAPVPGPERPRAKKR